MKSIQTNFGKIGNIYIKEKYNSVLFQVTSLRDLINIVIPYFNKYPLITQKRADFELFKMVVEIMNRKEHLTIEGLNKIVARAL